MRKLFYLPLLCLAVASVGGCNKHGASTDEQEERDPLVKTGQAYMDKQQWDDAEKTFKEALDNDPSMARPHLDLALIYQQYKPNYVHAIYHYDRYLELRPDSEKAEFIKEQKAKLEQAVANNIIKESPQVKEVLTELNRLQKENAALKKQLAAGSTTTATTTTAATVQPTTTKTTTAPPATTAPATQTAPTHQIYNVLAGDTLTKISNKFYGDPGKWDVIYEANKDTLKSPSDLRVGQTLVIPAASK